MIAISGPIIVSNLLSVFYGIASADPSYWPVKPPAVPFGRSIALYKRMDINHKGTLNTTDAIFWTGNKLDWEGIVIVDDVSYE